MKPVFVAPDSPYLAPFDGTLKHAACPTRPPEDVDSDKHLKKQLKKIGKELDDLQRRLYAQDRYAVLLVFQALDAAGKDGTIRAVFNRVDPAGLHVTSFKQPTPEELEHDFLWRTTLELPRRGNIGIFNRSHYEEVLVVRVHPEYLKSQRLPPYGKLEDLWRRRFAAIEEHERHLADSGTLVIKFWLKHSREEQRQRFMERLTEPRKHWKFSTSDVKERGYWNRYMGAYEAAVNATSRPWAPWYVIPADNKPFMRVAVADIVRNAMKSLKLTYPKQDAGRIETLAIMRQQLEQEGRKKARKK